MIGQITSHYKILEKLGEGGMGIVYKAEDTQLKRTVALKFLPPDLTRDPEAKDRFTHEAQAASALDHPNICNVHEIGETEDGQLFIVMASYEGETLKRKIEQGPLDVDLAMDIAIQTASGLSRAQEAGIVHRDIKPANIMVTERGEVKILDFGLAKLSGRTLLTKSGTTLGTAAYMSPEQARGEVVDARTDIWSLGVVLYEMLTGMRPFESDYEPALVYAILNQQPESMRKLREDIPEVLDQIVGKAMAKDPRERYQSAEQFLADLRVARGVKEVGGTIAAAEAIKHKRRKRSLRQGIIASSVVVVIILALFVVWPMVQDQLLASNPRTIAVMPFENLTRDKSLDPHRTVLQEATITSLENSKYIHVITRQRLADILKQMGKKDVDYIDDELGLEICRREGVELMAVGSFAKAGELYRTDLKLVDIKTLETVKTYAASGKGEESLLEKGGQIDDLCREISRGIGVSERRTEETIRPVEETRSSSTEATSLYIRGCQEYDRLSWTDARRYLEMAVQKDSQFAMAWFRLGYTTGWLKDWKVADSAIKKAGSLAWRASVRDQWAIAKKDSTLRARLLGRPGVSVKEFMRLRSEKYPREKEFLMEYGNDLNVRYREPDEAIQALQRALELDWNYPSAWLGLGYAYLSKRDLTNAMEAFERYEAASPGDPNPYDSMGNALDDMGRHAEAETYYKKALAVNPNWTISANTLAGVRSSMEDYRGAFQWLDTSFARAKDFGSRFEVQYFRASNAFWLGQLNEADRYLAKCDALVVNAGQSPEHAWDWLKIWIEYERRQFARSRRTLDLWGTAYLQRDFTGEQRNIRELFIELCRGFINVKEGIADSVTASLLRMDSIRARIPGSDTGKAAKSLVRVYRRYSNLLRSEWLLSTGRPQEALSAGLKTDAIGYTSGGRLGPIAGLENWNYPNWAAMVDILPRAYLALGQLDSCIAAYERAIKLPGPIFPRYHYRLAQVYERKGLKAKAIAEYEKFLKIWEKADPIYKEPADARERLARLRGKK